MQEQKEENQCKIKAQTKLRNGYPNWWCHTHFSPARGKNGTKLERCLKANWPIVMPNEKIYIDLDDYPGGVGIWGSLKAVFDSKREIPENGVHVHLRKNPDGEKEVDNTFREVYVKLPNGNLGNGEEWVLIDEYTAGAYTASNVFNKKLKVIKCKYCNREHVDADYFSVHYHKKHLCTYCGREFIDNEPGISNPVLQIQSVYNEKLKDRKLTKVDRKLIIKQEDYPGGIQIWGSNPAIIWTAKRSEEAGIHVHLFKEADGLPIVDDTFGYVNIDDIELDDEMIRYYMVQKSMPYLAKYLISLSCPNCDKEHFDKDDKGLNPHKIHDCENCGFIFEYKGRLKGVVSNPIIERLKKLEKKVKIIQ